MLHLPYRKFILLVFNLSSLITDKSNHENHFVGHHDTFITRNNTRITAQMGGMAILPCTVRLTSPATVSILQILFTLNYVTYNVFLLLVKSKDIIVVSVVFFCQFEQSQYFSVNNYSKQKNDVLV